MKGSYNWTEVSRALFRTFMLAWGSVLLQAFSRVGFGVGLGALWCQSIRCVLRGQTLLNPNSLKP